MLEVSNALLAAVVGGSCYCECFYGGSPHTEANPHSCEAYCNDVGADDFECQ